MIYSGMRGYEHDIQQVLGLDASNFCMVVLSRLIYSYIGKKHA